MAVLYTGGGVALEASTGATPANVSSRVGLIVRPAIPDCTFASGQVSSIGANVILSSLAGQWYVYAYAIGPVLQASTSEQQFRFYSSGGASTASLWRVRQWSSGGSTVGYFGGSDVMAVSPPGYLFRGVAGSKLGINTLSSGHTYAVAAWNQ